MQTYSVTQIEKLLKLHSVHTFAIFNPPKYQNITYTFH